MPIRWATSPPIRSIATTTNLSLIVYSLLGGMGTLFGPVIGAFMLVFITQVILGRLLDFHLFATGLLLVILVPAAPGGVLGLVRDLPAAPPRRRGARRMSAAPILRVDRLSQALPRPGRRSPTCRFAIEPRLDHQHHRPQRRRQIHAVQPGDRLSARRPPARSASRAARDHGHGDQPHRRARASRRAFQIARPFRGSQRLRQCPASARCSAKPARAMSPPRPARGMELAGIAHLAEQPASTLTRRPAAPSRGRARDRHAAPICCWPTSPAPGSIPPRPPR